MLPHSAKPLRDSEGWKIIFTVHGRKPLYVIWNGGYLIDFLEGFEL